MAALLGIGAGVYFLANNKSKPQVAANNNVVAPAANDQPGADQTQAVSDAGASQDSAAIINKILEAEKKGDDGTVDASVRQLQAHPPITTGDTEEAERLNKLGLAALKNAKYEDASTLFKSAAQANPADAKYFSNLAYAELNGGDFISAEEQVYKSIAIAPTRSVAWDDLGLVLAKKQDPDRAVAALLIGYRFSNEKTPIYFESLQKDPDTDVQAAATAALAKVQPSGQATDPILDPSLAPDGVVKELYRVHTDLNALFSTDEEKSKRNIPKYFDDQLCQQLLKASASGQIDADILWDTNGDPKLTNFTVSKGQLDQNGATVLVSFLSNGQEDHKTFDLRQTSNGWRIYDVIDKDGTHWIKLFGR